MPRRRARLHVPTPEPEPQAGGRSYLARLAAYCRLPPTATEAEIVAWIASGKSLKWTRRKLKLPSNATLTDCARELELIWRDEGVYIDELFSRYARLAIEIDKRDVERHVLQLFLASVIRAAKECELDDTQIELPF